MAARVLRIGVAAAGLLWHAAVERLGRTPADSSTLPQRLRLALERLGPTFIKLGQALSLRRDLLPEAWLAELSRLQDRAMPFPGAEARPALEAALQRPVNQVFAEFDIEPIAAASIAQVHRAHLADGRVVIVKIRRPGIRTQIDRDMKALIGICRLALVLAPRLHRIRPLQILQEIRSHLRKETDFRLEAHNIRRFAEALRDWPAVYVPEVVDDLYGEAVLVQQMSGGTGIGDPSLDGPRFAQLLLDVYLHQLFVVGLFHGDPHPGNLFVTPDGRLCFHDFGLVGFLDRRARRALALYLLAFMHQDAAWMLDAAIDLGLIGGMVDRAVFERGIEEILADYATRPLKDWSVAEAVLRVARLGSGENFTVPQSLVVLMRALFLVESALRTLDPNLDILLALQARGREVMERTLQESATSPAFARLRTEAALTAQDLPGLVAAWLHRAQRGGGPLLLMRHEGLERLEARLDRAGNRLSVALVTLGLYVAASLLMQHSLGPRVLDDLPLLALLAYALALWLSFRLIRAIARSGPL
ncbi:AarF/UbiB family protein [Elioraea tepidiphila]|jgi:ubiquinone biosynthesis protein|uniref:ABC1 kinase family protein n=1 Tax=Elioraea tepidiphila TaxID=457934 RepID=UPI002FD94AA3